VLDGANAAFVVALGPRPVRRTGTWHKAPVAGKRLQAGIEPNLPRRREW
jgi:hypothetical protein